MDVQHEQDDFSYFYTAVIWQWSLWRMCSSADFERFAFCKYIKDHKIVSLDFFFTITFELKMSIRQLMNCNVLSKYF